MDSLIQIAGTFGVPVVLLGLICWFVVVPIAQAYVRNLNKVGDAIPPIVATLQALHQSQSDTVDAVKNANANACKFVPHFEQRS